jgi:hypothetical protein
MSSIQLQIIMRFEICRFGKTRQIVRMIDIRWQIADTQMI